MYRPDPPEDFTFSLKSVTVDETEKILQKLTPKRENVSHNVIIEKNVTLPYCYKPH